MIQNALNPYGFAWRRRSTKDMTSTPDRKLPARFQRAVTGIGFQPYEAIPQLPVPEAWE